MATRAEAAKRRKRHTETGRFIQRTNGHTNDSAKIGTPVGVSSEIMRMLRPQAAFRWILPNRAAITPQYVEMVMRGALAGNHVQQWEIFDFMMDSWPTLSSCLQELTDGVLSKKLVFEPYCDEDEAPTPEAIERMKVVSEALRNMNPNPARDENDLKGTIKDLLGSWLTGITCLEVLWEPKEISKFGTVLAPRSTFWVHPVAYGFNADGQLGLRTVGNYSTNGTGTQPRGPNPPAIQSYPFSYLSAQPQPSTLETFPDHKFLIGLHKAKPGTALGGPMLRPLVWWWVAAGYCEDWLLNLAQLYGIPFRWVTYDPSTSPDIQSTIDTMLQNMGNSGYARFPSGTELNLMDVGAGRQAQYTPQGTMLDRADRYVREVVLGQTMTGNTMTSGKGGQAFGVVEKDVKQERIDAAGKYCCEVINKQLITSVLLLNYGDTTDAPRIRLLEENEGQFVDAQRDNILKGMGVPFGVDFIRKKYGIPEPADGEEVLEIVQVEPPGTQTPEIEFGDDGLPKQLNEDQPAMEQGDKAMQAGSGAYALGHPFYGNKWTSAHGKVWDAMTEGDRFDLLKKHHSFDAMVEPKPFRAFAKKSSSELSDVEKSRVHQMITQERVRQRFPSLTHSAENERRLMLNRGEAT